MHTWMLSKISNRTRTSSHHYYIMKPKHLMNAWSRNHSLKKSLFLVVQLAWTGGAIILYSISTWRVFRLWRKKYMITESVSKEVSLFSCSIGMNWWSYHPVLDQHMASLSALKKKYRIFFLSILIKWRADTCQYIMSGYTTPSTEYIQMPKNPERVVLETNTARRVIWLVLFVLVKVHIIR